MILDTKKSCSVGGFASVIVPAQLLYIAERHLQGVTVRSQGCMHVSLSCKHCLDITA